MFSEQAQPDLDQLSKPEQDHIQIGVRMVFGMKESDNNPDWISVNR